MSQSIQRAAEVLELVSVQPRTQSEIAEHLGVHRSTALRMLQTLTESGLTRRYADGRYGVGYRLAGLASVAAEQFDLANIARPHLAELGRECLHTVHLAVLDGSAIVYADKIEQPGMVRLYSQVGQPVVLHTAGVAKAILAFQPRGVVERLLDGHTFEKHTETTLTSPAAYLAELDTVRDRGWSVDDAEYENYINCVAMPIHDARGEVTAAVSVTALKAKADLPALEQLLPRLGQVVGDVSAAIGYRP
ncbi:IclR family transcriptional regulator [Nocardioides zeae]|uniref:IclR family transcriptional regulator n=1 Tax=Nocardioides imazamoxiresistens TaxID=3231893 RepID=A0ABU3Q2Q3_9ACTN|nr:IclR family transcriptional regulator [Nocardioides zeae]MDT9595332.1 IclR family transcriptional regulator [Nocardioides zeae]